MGRDAHILRVALGRGADEPPAWSHPLLQRQFRRNEHGQYVGIDPENPITYNQVFNDRGRPCDPNRLKCQINQASALNAVTRLVAPDTRVQEMQTRGVVSEAVEAMPPDGKAELTETLFPMDRLYTAVFLVNKYSVTWLDYLRLRLLTFEFDDDADFTGTLCNEFARFGSWAILSSGLPAKIFVLTGVIMVSRCFSARKWEIKTPLAKKLESWLHRGIVDIVMLNGELQGLQILPPMSLRNPLPLFHCFRDLTSTALLSTIVGAVVPALCILKYRNKWYRNLSGDIREGLIHYRTNAILYPFMRKRDVAVNDIRRTTAWFEAAQLEERQRNFHARVVPLHSLGLWSGCFNPLKWSGRRNPPKFRLLLAHAIERLYATFANTFGLKQDTLRWWANPSRVKFPIESLPAKSLANWPGYLATQHGSTMLSKLIYIPVEIFMTRLAMKVLLTGTLLTGISTLQTPTLRIPNQLTVMTSLRPLIPDVRGIGTEIGLRYAGNLAKKVAFTLTLDAVITLTLMSVENFAAVWYATKMREKEAALRIEREYQNCGEDSISRR